MWGRVPPDRTVPVRIALLLWNRPPRARSASAGRGAVLGVWQWVKFGGAVFAGAGLVTTDLIVLLAAGPAAGRFPTWFRSLAAAAVAYLALEAARWASAFVVLPGPIAWDFAWPAYTARLYADLPARYPQWSGWEEFLMRYCLATSALVAGGIALVGFALSPQRRDPVAAAGRWCSFRFFACLGRRLFHAISITSCTSAPPVALLQFRRPMMPTVAILLAWPPQISTCATPDAPVPNRRSR